MIRFGLFLQLAGYNKRTTSPFKAHFFFTLYNLLIDVCAELDTAVFLRSVLKVQILPLLTEKQTFFFVYITNVKRGHLQCTHTESILYSKSGDV